MRHAKPVIATFIIVAAALALGPATQPTTQPVALDHLSPGALALFRCITRDRAAEKESRSKELEDAKAELALRKSGHISGLKRTDTKFATRGTDPAGKVFYIYSTLGEKKAAITEQTGVVEMAKWRVTQADSFIPTLRPVALGEAGTVVGIIEVIQVHDQGNALVKYAGTTVWMKTDTTGWTDGNPKLFGKLMWVASTKTYSTVSGGTNTVFVLEEIPQASK